MNKEENARKLKVDFSELEMAMDNTSWEQSYYMDLGTGKVVIVTDEIRGQLEQVYDEIKGEDSDEACCDIGSFLDQLSLPDWKKGALREANEVENGCGTRYLSIPRADSGDTFGDMEDFIALVRNHRLRSQLYRVISRRNPFRRFMEILANNASEKEQWFHFKESRLRERILEWLKDEGIEPLTGTKIDGNTDYDFSLTSKN